ncbi:Alpha-1,4-N-acetylgalactosamine transferase PglH [hydrothermal vent metagenome]|uniref:Alpha-1,4-N-acetylgalactosamine transferase PglH n=1 Tax=hydrothermal vent metagenome TaxID=652676 RepID=A0A3B0QYH1_9ZZZZ
MRVLQLIDSLELGGAERFAVTLANALSSKIELSALCATRKEGGFKESVLNNVEYIFLNKKNRIDINAISRLNKFISKHNIQIIHAHSTSFFLATIIKLLNPKLKIVWHDHFGNSEYLKSRNSTILKLSSLFFYKIIVVNNKLKEWATQKLFCKKVFLMNNFVGTKNVFVKNSALKLHGQYGKRMLCIANLRPQKDHVNLLGAFSIVLKKHPDWTLHLVGKDFKDKYSEMLKQKVSNTNLLVRNVFFYGSVQDVVTVMNQSTIGVLSSKSEGLPISLLEYGFYSLPVIATNVGECNKLIKNKKTGLLVPPKNTDLLASGMLELIKDKKLRNTVAQNLNRVITDSYTEKNNIEYLINLYK